MSETRRGGRTGHGCFPGRTTRDGPQARTGDDDDPSGWQVHDGSGRRRHLADALRRPLTRTRRSRRRSRALAILTVAAAALIGCSPALAASTPRPPAPSYLFSIPTASGSLTGHSDRHLKLRLTDTRNYLTRFTDRPLRQAFVVANVDFARRFKTYFAGDDPNAVLTHARPGAQIPVSIVLTIRHPRWNARRHTWTFSATRIRKQPDNLPGTTVQIKPPSIASFTHATLLIDNTDSACSGTFFPGEDCEGVNFSGANLQGVVLSGIDLLGANLSYANLTGANLSYASLHGANLTGAFLTDSDLTEANLSGANLSGADLSFATLCHTTLPSGATLSCSPGFGHSPSP